VHNRLPTGAADTPLAPGPILPGGPTAAEPSSPAPPGTPAPTTGAPSTSTSATPSPKPTPSDLCGAPHNPYGYNFCGRGGLLFEPSRDICSFVRCDDAFWRSGGYLVECADHAYALGGGEPDGCAEHDGIARPLYRGP
jgi:hypothetical protein